MQKYSLLGMYSGVLYVVLRKKKAVITHSFVKSKIRQPDADATYIAHVTTGGALNFTATTSPFVV
jgi:hypothetical protein